LQEKATKKVGGSIERVGQPLESERVERQCLGSAKNDVTHKKARDSLGDNSEVSHLPYEVSGGKTEKDDHNVQRGGQTGW